jgi:hypothetical protein
MSAEQALTRSWKVGDRTCTLTMPAKTQPAQVRSACIEWDPAAPARLSAAEWQEYRAGRNAALADISRELGISVGVLEL